MTEKITGLKLLNYFSICHLFFDAENIVGKVILVTMRFERKTSVRKTKALASSKKVPQLFSAIFSSYVAVFRDGARHITIPLVRTLIVRSILYTRERLLSCSCVDVCP